MRFLRFLLFFGTLYLTGCTPRVPEVFRPEELIPGTAKMVLKINNPEQFRSEYRNSELLNTLMGTDSAPWRVSLQAILELDPPPGSLLVLSDSLRQPGEWLLLFPGGKSRTDSVSDKGTGPEDPVWDFPDSTGLHFQYLRNVPVLASSRPYFDQVLEGAETPPIGLEKALVASNPLASATLLLAPGLPDPFTGGVAPESDAPGAETGVWSSYDFLTGRSTLGMQRLQNTGDTEGRMRNLLSSIPALPLQRVASVIPADADSWISYSLEGAGLFSENQKTTTGAENPNPELLESVEQLTLVEAYDSMILILHSLNASLTEEELRPFRGEATEFQGALIYPMEETTLLGDTFDPLLGNLAPPRFYAALEDTFVFSPSQEALQGLISHKNRRDTFDQTRAFEYLNPSLASESSVLLISKNPAASEVASDSLFVGGLSPALLRRLPAGYLLSSQYNLENPYTLGTYLFLDGDLPPGDQERVLEVFTASLESPAATRPQFLKNHRDGTMDIAVQDENNTLYLFSNEGTLFWKKDIGSRIQGDIRQVDLFRNGRLQMAFTTTNELWVLDRDGKMVSPYPKKFEGGNLNPLAVFDYENNRNYRLVVTQGARVFMFDGEARAIAGFKFRDAGSPVINPPEHFRISGRDYLVFQLENGQLKILNRVGDSRIAVREAFDFSGNRVYEYRNGFAFTDRNGNLVSIDTRGKVGRTALNLGPDHGMVASTRTLALMDDNRFRVKANERELELGVYSRPQLFYLYDIIYVAVTDLQSQQVHLFRSTSEEVSGFPVEGSGLPDMADMDNDRNPELVTPYRDNGIRVYKVVR
jgi:hypothetical protein